MTNLAMSFSAPGPVSTTAFLLVVAGVMAAFLAGTYFAHKRAQLPAAKATRWAAAGLLLWLGLTSLGVASGFVEANPMPRLLFLFAALNLAALATGLSPLGRRLASLPLTALVAFQAFRLPLELVLHSWAAQGSIPVTMTWEGRNFDVVTGVASLLLAPLAGRFGAAAWVANLIGIALLLNVFRVVMLSSPLPFAWKVDPPLQLAFHLPYALIGTVCVAGAVLGHVVLTRALMKKH